LTGFIRDAEDRGHGGREQTGIGNCGKLDEPAAIRETIGLTTQKLEGESRLANATRPRQRKEAHALEQMV
jgi:hypothetical protein